MTNFILVAFIYICQIRILASLIPSYKKIKLLWAPLESIPHAYIYIIWKFCVLAVLYKKCLYNSVSSMKMSGLRLCTFACLGPKTKKIKKKFVLKSISV